MVGLFAVGKGDAPLVCWIWNRQGTSVLASDAGVNRPDCTVRHPVDGAGGRWSGWVSVWTYLRKYANIRPWTGKSTITPMKSKRLLMPCPGIRAFYVRLTERMRHYGPNLGMPFTRSMGQGLFEIRGQKARKALAGRSSVR